MQSLYCNARVKSSISNKDAESVESIHMRKKFNSYLTPYTEINSNWMLDLKVKGKANEIFEEINTNYFMTLE